LEPEQNYKAKGNKKKIRVAHGSKVPKNQNAGHVAINALDYRTYILDILKTCWDFKTGRYTNVFEVIADFNLLLYSYNQFKTPKSATTVTENQGAINSTDFANMKRLQKRLLKESWGPGMGKRVLIDKTKSSDKCPFIIVSNQGKIVATSIQHVLELIYEGSFHMTGGGDLAYSSNLPIFLENSHGFRPHLGCHTVVKAVERMGILSWLFKGDIEKCFDTINQKRLLNILKENI
jgi:hypothetical protein